MGSSLSTQLLTVYQNHCLQIDSLLRNYNFHLPPKEMDLFHSAVRNRFILGVHSAFNESILQALSEELGPQQEIAEALGLKNRTSISKMIKSGTMDGIRITTAFYLCPDLLKKLPTSERAALYGFARATSFIKALVYDDKRIERTMKPQDFSYLIGVLASSEWSTASLDRNHDNVRKLAKQIILERTISTVEPGFDVRNREEQYVLKLQDLKLAWGDFAVIALWAIPEYIPEDSVDEGGTI
jgi:hypothetical protein